MSILQCVSFSSPIFLELSLNSNWHNFLTWLIWIDNEQNSIRNNYESWVYGYDPETKLFSNFPYNENPVRAQNTSHKWCLPSTVAINRQEKIYACVWRFKVTMCKHASLKSTRFSQKDKVGYFSNWVVYIIKETWKGKMIKIC